MMTEENDWCPVYSNFDETKVSMDYDTLTLSRSGREITLTLQISTQPDYAGDGALFWIDIGHVYLRYNWQTWYQLPQDNLDILKDVARRHAITLSIFKDNDFRLYPLRLFHIDKLPDHLFDEKVDESDVSATEDSPDESFPPSESSIPDDAEVLKWLHVDQPDTKTCDQPSETHKPDFSYAQAVKHYHAFSGKLAEICHLPDDTPETYDEFLRKASKMAWAKMLPPFKKELERRGVNHFPHVKLNDGWADDAFSNDKTALLVQVYKGENNIQRQIKELTAVASDLQANEPDSVVMIGIVFDDLLPAPPLPPSVDRITPEFLREFTRLFPVETSE